MPPTLTNPTPSLPPLFLFCSWMPTLQMIQDPQTSPTASPMQHLIDLLPSPSTPSVPSPPLAPALALALALVLLRTAPALVLVSISALALAPALVR